MGKLKLLKGAFEGKVGVNYGVKQRSNHYLKAVPFSHTPHNEKQKMAFSAFGCLQRMSSQFVSGFWENLGLSSKNLNKINAVAHWLKPVMSEKVFSPAKIINVITSGEELKLTDYEYIPAESKISVSFKLNFDNPDATNVKINLAFIGENGQGFGAYSFYSQSGTLTFTTSYDRSEELAVIMFLSYDIGKKHYVNNCSVIQKGGQPFIDRFWYPNNMFNGTWFYDSEKQVASLDAKVTYASNIMYA